MSFAFLAFYTGDYFRDTRGLSMAGHGCYFLLLTYCWDAQGPLPLDEERIAGICEARNQEERTTMQKILRTYFTRMDDGWYNGRMQREIEKACAISLVRKSAGAKGYQAKAKHLPSKSLALAEHVPLHSPPPPPSPPPPQPPSPQPPKARSKTTTEPPAAAWDWPIPLELWAEFRQHRLAMKAKMTEGAERRLLIKLQNFASKGHDPAAIVGQSIERGWKGFFPVDRDQVQVSDPSSRLSLAGQRTAEAARRFADQMESDDGKK